MLAIERHKFILNLLAEKGQVTTTELCDALSVSPATIRNDLHKLHGLAFIKINIIVWFAAAGEAQHAKKHC